MINWFPGHMAKSLRELKEKQKVFDLFIILLDARLPLTSFNPEIYKIANKKPILFIFNKADKTNKDKINAFIPQYQKMGEVILSNLKDKKSILKINLAPSFDEEQIFAEINQYARRNKILKVGNEIDLNKSIKLLLQYFKNIDNIIYD